MDPGSSKQYLNYSRLWLLGAHQLLGAYVLLVYNHLLLSAYIICIYGVFREDEMAACSKTTIPEEQKLDVLRWYSLNIIVYVVFYHTNGV